MPRDFLSSDSLPLTAFGNSSRRYAYDNKKRQNSMIFHIFLLVAALGLDTFVASAAYGANRVRFTFLQIAAANAICSGCLGIALLFGNLLQQLIPSALVQSISFGSLLLLGLLKLSDSYIRRYLRRHRQVRKNIRFHFLELHFIISIYGDPMEADADRNHALSWKEVVFFSFAMSIDSLIAGTMAAFLDLPVWGTVAASFLMGELFTWLGLALGRSISRRCPKDLSWAGGLLFLLLAFARL